MVKLSKVEEKVLLSLRDGSSLDLKLESPLALLDAVDSLKEKGLIGLTEEGEGVARMASAT